MGVTQPAGGDARGAIAAAAAAVIVVAIWVASNVMQPAGGDARGAIAAAAAAVIVVAIWVASKLMRRGRGRLPPGPRGLPLVGNLLELVGGELPHRAMARLSKKYGPIVFLKLGTLPTVLVSEPDLARACLSGPNDKIFASRPPMELMRRVVFNDFPGVCMAPYGEQWRQGRKLCSLQLFTMKRVEEFEPIRRGEIMALVRSMEQQVGQPVNLTQALADCAEAATCKMLLGKPLAEICDVSLGMNMQTVMHRGTELFQVPMIGDFIPALGFLDHKLKASADELHSSLDILVSKLIREHRPHSPGSPQVILDVLLRNLDPNQAKTMILELIAVGVDTISTTLDWAMAELVGNPQAMRRLQMELDEVAKKERRVLKGEDLCDLVYLKAVVKETFRLHPPAPLLLPHMSIEECEIGGYRIPKGSKLLVNVWDMGRNPKCWEEPERFMPERFLTEKGALLDLRGKHFELLPFGSGRRSCPGMPLALPFLHATIANLVHNFEWSLPPNHTLNLEEHFGVVVNRLHPLLLIPHLRYTKVQ